MAALPAHLGRVLTQDERRALLFLAAVTTVGAGFRAFRSGEGAGVVPGAVAPALAGGDIVRQAERSRRAEALARPLGPGERVDVDRAGAEELQRLPRVGRALAQRIVDEREARGPFGSLAGLSRVSGVGPRMLRELEPHVSFGGVVPVAGAAEMPRPRSPSASPAGVAGELPGRPAADRRRPAVWIGRSAAPDPAPAGRGAGGCEHEPDLNRATEAELTCLPGIGKVLAGRIVAERAAHGPFRELDDLARVPGLGRVRILRLRGRVTIP